MEFGWIDTMINDGFFSNSEGIPSHDSVRCFLVHIVRLKMISTPSVEGISAGHRVIDAQGSILFRTSIESSFLSSYFYAMETPEDQISSFLFCFDFRDD